MKRSTILAAAHRAFLSLRDAVTGRDDTAIVSEVERELFTARIPGVTPDVLPNGVDVAHFASRGDAERHPRTAIFTTTTLEEIEISGETALVRKKFDGGIKRADGTLDVMRWQTLYYCRLHEGRWKISGFTGYLPNPMGMR